MLRNPQPAQVAAALVVAVVFCLGFVLGQESGAADMRAHTCVAIFWNGAVYHAHRFGRCIYFPNEIDPNGFAACATEDQYVLTGKVR